MQNLQKKLTRALAVSLVLIMGLVLAGCGGVAATKADVDLSIDKNLAISGTSRATIDLVRLEKEKSIFTSVMSPSAIEREVDGHINDLRQDAPEGMTVEKIRTSSEIGFLVTLDKVLADELDPEGRDIVLEKDGGAIVLTMASPAASYVLSEFALPSDPAETFIEAPLTLTFPGDIIEADGGRVNGNTVTYDLRTYGQDVIVVKAEAPSFPWLFVFIIIGVLLLLIIGAVVIFLLLKKKNTAQPAAPIVGGQYPYDGQTSAYPEYGPYTGQVQTQGYQGQLPPAGYAGQLPPPDYSNDVPTQGYSGYPGYANYPSQQPPQGSGPIPPNPPQGSRPMPPQGSGPMPPQPPQPPQA